MPQHVSRPSSGCWPSVLCSMPLSGLTSGTWIGTASRPARRPRMARDIKGRIILRGTLVARTPLHVGGLGDDVDTDLPLARDGAGRLYAPGTSLAGALRQWCVEQF